MDMVSKLALAAFQVKLDRETRDQMRDFQALRNPTFQESLGDVPNPTDPNDGPGRRFSPRMTLITIEAWLTEGTRLQEKQEKGESAWLQASALAIDAYFCAFVKPCFYTEI